jgi:hypothetical protein
MERFFVAEDIYFDHIDGAWLAVAYSMMGGSALSKD